MEKSNRQKEEEEMEGTITVDLVLSARVKCRRTRRVDQRTSRPIVTIPELQRTQRDGQCDAWTDADFFHWST